MSSNFARSGTASGSWGYRRVLVAAGVLAVSALLASCSMDGALNERPVASAVVKPQKPSHKLAAAKHARIATPQVAAAKAPAHPQSRTFEVQMANVTEVAAYGRGPWICSPSGFGQKSHCVARGTLLE